jgi:DNA-binding transcriptional LysR family regulator
MYGGGGRARRAAAASARLLRLGRQRLLPDVLRTFGERHPSLAVSVRELLLGNLDAIRDGNVDVAVTRLQPGQTELEVELLAEEPRLVALSSEHRLSDRESRTSADLSDEDFIVDPVTAGDDPPQRWIAEQRRRGLLGRIAAQSTSIQEILTLVGTARGVCLVPATPPPGTREASRLRRP